MRTFLTKLLCSAIPTRFFKSKIRNVLWGKFESEVQFKSFLSIAAIVKNEGIYFKEWIEYHRLIGIDKFYIYDNESTDDTCEILKPYIKQGIVEYTYFPGKKRQKPAYRDCLKKHKYDSKWIAFIDLDEFIVPLDCDTIPQFLEKLPKTATQLCIGWFNYGNSGFEDKQNGLVIEVFKHTSGKAANYGKYIVNPRDVCKPNVHKCKMIGGFTIDENMKPIKRFDWQLDRDVLKKGYSIQKIRINHYQIKSWEEYSKKYERGDVNRSKPRYTRELYDRINSDKTVADNTMDKHIDSLKNRLNDKENGLV
ncbi:MAG: glycosyltransferase family 92 protein [Bacteroidales bacterium]|nr:glycosyltransferase family 92 protein [Bacteroidales bacterium]